jgi:hypothetical protein
MPRTRKDEAPIMIDEPPITGRYVELDDYTVSFETFHTDMDPAALFVGLPDDRCQCPHWGYLIKGSFRVTYRGEPDEIVHAGEAYHLRPGHFVQTLEPVELVELSPVHQHDETMAVVARNMGVPA